MRSNSSRMIVVSLVVLVSLAFTSALILPGCESKEVLRTRYRWGLNGGANLKWARQPVEYPINSEGGAGVLYSIFAADAEHVWATGSGGGIVALENGVWKQSMVTNPADLLFGVSALDSTHVWAVGLQQDENARYAAIWFFDGKVWRQQANKEFKGVALKSVYALGTKHVWAVGEGGAILFFDGAKWTRQESGTSDELTSVSAVDASQVSVAGEKGSVLYYDGVSWKKRDSGGLSLSSVSAIDASQVWALGENPNQPGSSGVYCWDGSRWILSLQTSVKFIPTTVYALASNHIWVSGTNHEPGGPAGEVAFFDGESWNFQRIEVGIGFDAMTASDPSHVWAVGNSILLMKGFSLPSIIYFGTNQP